MFYKYGGNLSCTTFIGWAMIIKLLSPSSENVGANIIKCDYKKNMNVHSRGRM